jgi:hypothetical protein
VKQVQSAISAASDTAAEIEAFVPFGTESSNMMDERWCVRFVSVMKESNFQSDRMACEKRQATKLWCMCIFFPA